jgi:hypothetical protein
MANCFELITEAMKKNNDSWDCLEASTLADIFQEFRQDYDGPNGEQFVLWTTTKVYFSRNYDGFDYVDSVERNP